MRSGQGGRPSSSGTSGVGPREGLSGPVTTDARDSQWTHVRTWRKETFERLNRGPVVTNPQTDPWQFAILNNPGS